MSEPFLGQISLFSFSFAPKGWAQCAGQLLPIAQNQPLFALLGTTYGGDGRVNFALPDLRGRVPVSTGEGLTLGERAGEEAHTLILGELPQHLHFMHGNSTNASTNAPTGGLLAASPGNVYSNGTPGVRLNQKTLRAVGASQAHENRQPHLVIEFCIALQGIFPSQT